MKQVFGQEALQMIPGPSGFVFVIKQEEREDNKAVIAYKMLDFEKQTLTAVTRSVYLLAKFGNLFPRFEENPDEFLQMRTLFLPEHRLLVCDGKGEAVVYTADGRTERRLCLTYEGCVPDNLVLGEEFFFASYPEAGAVIRYDLRSFRQQLRIGGGDGRLPRPEGLYYQHGQLLICSPESQTIWELDPVTFALEKYDTFDEPVHRFLKYHSNEMVLLDSGVYKL